MKAREQMDNTLALLTGMALGAGLMYIFDPDRGARRRALARDQIVGAANDSLWWGRKQARNAGNHLWGSVAELRSNLRDRLANISDEVLHERVRAQLGHVVSHPGSLQIEVMEGCVVVRGPVLAGEEEKIRERLAQTRGVREWQIDVEVHEDPSRVPGLQGTSRGEREDQIA